MYNPDLIACLYPFDDSSFGYAAQTIAYNTDRSSSAVYTDVCQHIGGRSRQACEHLQLRFSKGPKSSLGFILGTDPDCDIVLPQIAGVAQRHCAFQFDAQQRLVLTDLGSENGTSVSYDGQGGNYARANFTWMLDRDSRPWVIKEIILVICESLKFRIHAPYKSSGSDLDDTDPSVLLPWKPSGTHRSVRATSDTGHVNNRQRGMGAIMLKRKVGHGHFGTQVSQAWDISTNKQFAIKEPSQKAWNKGRVRPEAWNSAARFMAGLKHDHIVRLLCPSAPRTELRLEYAAGGSLRDAAPLSRLDCKYVLVQVSSALEYLHNLDKPVVHRDLKPENILIHERRECSIVVKLADFGLSKTGYDLRTQRGTLRYVAPELYDIQDHEKGPTAWKQCKPQSDVWSLGIVIMEIVFGLPPFEGLGIRFCQQIQRILQDSYDRKDHFRKTLEKMLKVNPSERVDAGWTRRRATWLLECRDYEPETSASPERLAQTARPARAAKRRRDSLSDKDGDEEGNGLKKFRCVRNDEDEMDED